jgi:hypothetical protein
VYLRLEKSLKTRDMNLERTFTGTRLLRKGLGGGDLFITNITLRGVHFWVWGMVVGMMGGRFQFLLGQKKKGHHGRVIYWRI